MRSNKIRRSVHYATVEEATILVDGTEVTSVTSDDVRIDNAERIRFGSGNNNEQMHARYSMVEFAIPEPGTAALVVGSLGLMDLRRRRHA